MLFSPLFSLLTDRQTKGKALQALPRGCSPEEVMPGAQGLGWFFLHRAPLASLGKWRTQLSPRAVFLCWQSEGASSVSWIEWRVRSHQRVPGLAAMGPAGTVWVLGDAAKRQVQGDLAAAGGGSAYGLSSSLPFAFRLLKL